MAEPFTFDRDTCARFLDCVANGKPIEGRLDRDQMLTLAGVCLFAARTHGTFKQRRGRAGAIDYDLGGLPPEHREASDQTSLSDSLAVVNFVAGLAQEVCDDNYDTLYEPVCAAWVFGAEFRVSVRPVRGFRIGFGDDSSDD
jgi:hypothetical protein